MKTFKQFKKMHEAMVAPPAVPAGLGNYTPQRSPTPVIKRTPDAYNASARPKARPAQSQSPTTSPTPPTTSPRPKPSPFAEIQRQTNKEIESQRNRLLRKTPSQNSPARDIARDSSNRERSRRATPAQSAFKAFRNNRSEPFKMFNRPKAKDT